MDLEEYIQCAIADPAGRCEAGGGAIPAELQFLYDELGHNDFCAFLIGFRTAVTRDPKFCDREWVKFLKRQIAQSEVLQ